MTVKSDSQSIISTNSIEAEFRIFRKEDGFTHFECSNCQFLNRPGQPAIPWKAVDVLLPLEADINSVSVSFDAARFEETPVYTSTIIEVVSGLFIYKNPHGKRKK